jgi:hypothetical protein
MSKLQQKKREERKPFRDAVKIYLQCKDIPQNYLCNKLDLTKQEFNNLMTGYQNSVPSKGIESFSDFEYKVMDLLGADFTEGRIQY